jgi:putative DNA primase/helicase
MAQIHWLWEGWLAAGKFHVLAGAPGTGKTTIGIAFAAVVSRGGLWPDGTEAPDGSVLIWSGEDDPADTLNPRLKAAGADLTRCHFVGDTRDGMEARTFDPARDLDVLARAAEEIGDIRLVLVDPVVSAVAGDSHKNTEVRRALQPMVEMADRLGAAVLGISHFSKGTAGRDPLERVAGSLAFGALPRLVLVAAKGDGNNGAGRILARAKNNIGPDGGGFGYEFELTQVQTGIEATRIRWGAPLGGSARELLGAAEGASDGRTDAAAWLEERLAAGPVPVRALRREQADADFSWRTLESAKKALGVVAVRHSNGNDGAGYWAWSLPVTADLTTPQVLTPDLAVLPEGRSRSVRESDNSARPQDRRVDEGGDPADKVRCLDCRHAILSTVNREGGLAMCSALKRGGVAVATHVCGAFEMTQKGD